MKRCLLLVSTFYCAFGFAQSNPALDETDKVDFKQVDAEISIFPEKKLVEGNVDYSFDVLAPTDSLHLDAKNMIFEQVFLNGKKAEFKNDNKRLWIISHFSPSKSNTISLKYRVKPSQTMYFINWEVPDSTNATRQVWTQGQGKYTSYWLPSFDNMKEKSVYNLTINFRKGYEVIANGALQQKKDVNDSITSWRYSMKNPMSSYLVAVAAGKYLHKNLETSSGVPLKLYYQPEDLALVETTFRYTDTIFNFFQKEIGYPYPWQSYKEVPVQDFLYSGMENTGTTIFSNSLMVDSIAFNDQNYCNVNAHELAHQWFGDLITETTGEDHWLQEGFATYYALLAEKQLFGSDYYYWKLYQSAEQLKDLSDTGKGEALLGTTGSSLTYYQKGAWALHILREKIGDEAFKKGIKSYLEKYAFKTVTTDDFLNEMEKASGTDLSSYKKAWLEQTAFQGFQALNSLKKSDFIKKYLSLAALKETALPNKVQQLDAALDFPVNDYIGQEAVNQLKGYNTPAAMQLYKKAFNSGNLYVRQAIAVNLDSIPSELKTDFEGLLKDKSYITQENALLKLWLQFPDETKRLLQETKGVQGFFNKNIRMLWLTINLVSSKIDPDKTQDYYEELSGYTRSYNPLELRKNAFGYLYQINAFTKQNLIDLLQGTRHPVYRFRDFCRKLLDTLMQNPDYRQRFEVLKSEIPPENLKYLNKILN